MVDGKPEKPGCKLKIFIHDVKQLEIIPESIETPAKPLKVAKLLLDEDVVSLAFKYA